MTRSDLRGWAAIILAVGSVIASLRKPPEDAAKAGYIELTKAILDAQAQQKQDHSDLEALRKYVSDYVEGHRSVVYETAIDAGADPQKVDLSKATVKKVTFAIVSADAGVPRVQPIHDLPPPPPVANIHW